MIPLGAVEFSPADIALILAVLTLGATALALPATLTLAWVGARRGRNHPGWTALWYWFAGTALCLTTTALAAGNGLGWWAVPAGWVPTLLLAAALEPHWPRKRARLGVHDNRWQGER
ncbi:hypothetical protein [Kribbella solani]|uniref:Protein-S-isoprenylcysteine O-methyltransferase Ste14 n=1 Tax=Kribbella solani TaxID=236067 RepID=A0A841DVT0_9ACTN|nr:hypothetical protein [Kribbella solani]MBB5982703.1 protein-S-isoprenylcysteine O-methyltransferase Ste14 [Kribbella solani]